MKFYESTGRTNLDSRRSSASAVGALLGELKC